MKRHSCPSVGSWFWQDSPKCLGSPPQPPCQEAAEMERGYRYGVGRDSLWPRRESAIPPGVWWSWSPYPLPISQVGKGRWVMQGTEVFLMVIQGAGVPGGSPESRVWFILCSGLLEPLKKINKSSILPCQILVLNIILLLSSHACIWSSLFRSSLIVYCICLGEFVFSFLICYHIRSIWESTVMCFIAMWLLKAIAVFQRQKC